MDGVSTEDSIMRRRAGEALQRWTGEGRATAVVRVLERHGFGTVQPGQLLAGTTGGEHVGALLGGTLDAAALPLLSSAIDAPATTSGRVGEHDALAAGLACSGGATLLGHPLAPAAAVALSAAVGGGVPAALASSTDGRSVLVATGPTLSEVHGSLGTAD